MSSLSSLQSTNVQGPELPAAQIISTLQENPDVADNLKAAAEQRGIFLTDQEIVQRLQVDRGFRIQVTQALIAQGVVDPNDPALINNQSGGMNSQNGGTFGQNSDGFDSLPSSEDGIPQRGASPTGSTSINGNSRTSQRERTRPPGSIPTKRQDLPAAYQNIPSLRDLYSQVSDFSTRLDRFGADVFDVGNANPSTTDASVGPDYVLGPGDTLSITVWGGVSRRIPAIIDSEGRISLPEVGTVLLQGKTLGEARDIIQKSLATQFHNIQSDVSLTRVRFVRIYVVGDVVHPGAYNVSAISTMINAVAAAGGPTQRGSLRHIEHLRGDKVLANVDLYDLLLKGVRGNISGLEPGDTVLVPTVGPQVSVVGMVRRPAIYELRDEASLADVLDLAGGVLAAGSLKEVRVERIQAHEQKIMMSLKLPDLKNGDGLKSALAGFKAQDGDRILIGAIAPYSNQAVYLDGHVIHPGKYSYHEGMTVADIVHSYQELLPEPADRAQIIRLRMPDLHPEVIQFNLKEVLGGADPVTLQPFDTVRILGRYEQDAPMVAVYGEVVHPGEYPMSDGMSAADLVRMAGGLKRSAYTETADLASYTVDKGKQVEVESRTVEIGKALTGVQDTDVRLKPRDVLTIRQLAGWNTVGTVVRVTGEVNYPGTYGIVEGERLSNVLRRAGGFRPGAFPQGAVLTRQEVKIMNEKARDALILRVQSMTPDIKAGPSETPGLVVAAQAQQQQMVKRLKETPIAGRQVIQISADISKWENTQADIEVRPGDTILIPKYPTFVAVQGQVNSPSAITYVPGERASWYFKRAGGATNSADKKNAFIVRADGSVVGKGSSSGFWGGGVMSTVLRPGDTLVIPEKIITGSSTLRAVMQTVQTMSQVALTAGVFANF